MRRRRRLVAEALAAGVCGWPATRRAGLSASGDQAIELMRRHRPRLAMVDVDLATARTGRRRARLRRHRTDPVIFVTGLPDMIARATPTPGVAWMEKPYRVLDLINALDTSSARRPSIAVTIPDPGRPCSAASRHVPRQRLTRKRRRRGAAARRAWVRHAANVALIRCFCATFARSDWHEDWARRRGADRLPKRCASAPS